MAKPEGHDTGVIDAHPLIRTYFAAELQENNPSVWQEGNLRLYEYLRTSTPEYPNTLEEMQPLFFAVIHGCRAGRHQEALTDIFSRRIHRGADYAVSKLGALGLNLTALGAFFDHPWDHPTSSITDEDQAWLLGNAGFLLRGLGRLSEAVQPMLFGLTARLRDAKWRNAAIAASNLSDLTLTLGEVTDSLSFAEQSVALADINVDIFTRLNTILTLGYALHQAGRFAESNKTLDVAEAIIAEPQMENRFFYSGLGSRYCDLKMSEVEPEKGAGLEGISSTMDEVAQCRQICEEIIDRTWRALALPQDNRSLLPIGLDQLSLGRAYLILALAVSDVSLTRTRGEYLCSLLSI